VSDVWNLDHVILTRYNLPSAGAERFVRARDGWLRDRTGLFETYTVPSVMAQSERRFVWLVFFDSASPEWLRQRIASWASEGVLVPVFGEEFSRKDLERIIREHTSGSTAAVLTTNLDNDDAISVDFVARLQAAARAADPDRAIYLAHGLIKGPSGLFLRNDRHNAFVSVLSTWDEVVTCWSEWHNRLHLMMPTTELGGAPGWLQVIHGDNVSNRVRGRLVDPSTYVESFPRVIDDLVTPTRRELLADRLVWAPLRTARDGGRAILKSAALAVGGKDVLVRSRDMLARLRASGAR
jgi:hypothetical protein